MKKKELIKTVSLSYEYPGSENGIKNINLSVYKGEFILFAGKNGSGKTTLFRHFNGLLKPSSGKVFVDGRSVEKNITYARKSIGMVFQEPESQIVGETVFEDICFGPENLRLKRDEIEKKALKAMKDTNLLHLKERPPYTLSGGEKKRLAIAGIIVMEPSVIILDEPFTNLDYSGTKDLINILVNIGKTGTAIIISTHDIEKIITSASRLILMDNGEIKEDDNPFYLLNKLEEYGIREPCASKFGMEPVPWII